MAKKKEKTKKPAYKIHRIYKVEGDKIVDKNRACPKCGQGVFMARHKDRWHCGKCGYTEFIKSE